MVTNILWTQLRDFRPWERFFSALLVVIRSPQKRNKLKYSINSLGIQFLYIYLQLDMFYDGMHELPWTLTLPLNRKKESVGREALENLRLAGFHRLQGRVWADYAGIVGKSAFNNSPRDNSKPTQSGTLLPGGIESLSIRLPYFSKADQRRRVVICWHLAWKKIVIAVGGNWRRGSRNNTAEEGWSWRFYAFTKPQRDRNWESIRRGIEPIAVTARRGD